MGKGAFTRWDLDLRSRIILKEIFNVVCEIVDWIQLVQVLAEWWALLKRLEPLG